MTRRRWLLLASSASPCSPRLPPGTWPAAATRAPGRPPRGRRAAALVATLRSEPATFNRFTGALSHAPDRRAHPGPSRAHQPGDAGSSSPGWPNAGRSPAMAAPTRCSCGAACASPTATRSRPTMSSSRSRAAYDASTASPLGDSLQVGASRWRCARSRPRRWRSRFRRLTGRACACSTACPSTPAPAGGALADGSFATSVGAADAPGRDGRARPVRARRSTTRASASRSRATHITGGETRRGGSCRTSIG